MTAQELIAGAHGVLSRDNFLGQDSVQSGLSGSLPIRGPVRGPVTSFIRATSKCRASR